MYIYMHTNIYMPPTPPLFPFFFFVVAANNTYNNNNNTQTNKPSSTDLKPQTLHSPQPYIYNLSYTGDDRLNLYVLCFIS